MKYLLLLALGLVPTLSFAATYHYVNTQGETASVEAPNAATALVLPSDIASNSGVALDLGYIEPGMDVDSPVNAFGYSNDSQGLWFHFVNIFGLTDSVQAPNAQAAIQVAPNIAGNSGVAVDQGDIDDGEVVESVAN